VTSVVTVPVTGTTIVTPTIPVTGAVTVPLTGTVTTATGTVTTLTGTVSSAAVALPLLAVLVVGLVHQPS
jgi:hypothetical protein